MQSACAARAAWCAVHTAGCQTCAIMVHRAANARACECAEHFYLGATECLMEYWREAGKQPEQLQEVLHRAEQRAKSNVWPMIQRALAH